MGAKSRGNFPHYPNPEQCCEACIFGSGEHSSWCNTRFKPVEVKDRNAWRRARGCTCGQPEGEPHHDDCPRLKMLLERQAQKGDLSRVSPGGDIPVTNA